MSAGFKKNEMDRGSCLQGLRQLNGSRFISAGFKKNEMDRGSCLQGLRQLNGSRFISAAFKTTKWIEVHVCRV